MLKSIIQVLLTPLATMYTIVVEIRKYLYKIKLLKSEKASLPTFCVGNVVIGGSGKTPFTAFLVKTLKEQGHKPAILLRGYKGKLSGPHLVSSNNTAEEVGDEAILHLKNNVPVVISKDRAAGVNFIKSKDLANCVVMDDGLQHLALKANHYFLLLDVSDEQAINKWKHGKVIPAGYLREPLNTTRADSKVLVNKDSEKFNEECDFRFILKPNGIYDLYDNSEAKLKGNCNVLCAIANPQSFLQNIKKLGLNIAKQWIFTDHHAFTQTDWKKVSLELPLIITSKDAVKLRKYIKNKGQVFVLEQSASICETSKFKDLIQEVINAK